LPIRGQAHFDVLTTHETFISIFCISKIPCAIAVEMKRVGNIFRTSHQVIADNDITRGDVARIAKGNRVGERSAARDYRLTATINHF